MERYTGRPTKLGVMRQNGIGGFSVYCPQQVAFNVDHILGDRRNSRPWLPRGGLLTRLPQPSPLRPAMCGCFTQAYTWSELVGLYRFTQAGAQNRAALQHRADHDH
ncbi:MAG: hypothetical protein ACLPKB_27765 [Xanthobacteraceae bacterium]